MKVILFGTGNYYRQSKAYIDMTQVICFVDNDPKKTGAMLDGKKIMTPKEADFTNCDYVLVLVMRYQSILEQLSALGVSRDKIKLYPDLDDLFEVKPCICSEGKQYDFTQWAANRPEKKVMLICHELTRNGVSVVLMHVAQVLKRNYRKIILIIFRRSICSMAEDSLLISLERWSLSLWEPLV